MKISRKIYMLRTKYEMTQAQIAQIAGVSDKAVSTWEAGTKEPRMSAIQKICHHFNIDINAFVDDASDIYDSTLPKNIIPLPRTYEVPLIGEIACGEPILAVEDAEETVAVPEHVHADFALRCKGDSMINARIFDGDIVYIRRQNDVDDGEIAAVLIDEEATLKRVRKYPDHVSLEPANPMYQPFVYWGADADSVHIIGKAVAFTSVVR